MAIDVPNSPKVMTTKYQSFRGVDYTNDPSNVWYRRSPNGLNMLPGLDGNPFKRNGWKVEFTPEDFLNAKYDAYETYSSDNNYVVGDVCKRTIGEDTHLYKCKTTVLEEAWDDSKWDEYTLNSSCTIDKVDYFELGGAEYLFFYTSQGCFYYVDELKYIAYSYEVEDENRIRNDEKPYSYKKSLLYKRGDYAYSSSKYYRRHDEDMTIPETTLDASKWFEVDADKCRKLFPPTIDGQTAGIVYNKSFFFEGGGRSAYYLFADNKMYWFDGEILHEAHPTIPTVLTMCSASGAGEFLEDTNMLTEWRSIEYTCEEGGTVFYIPDGFDYTTVSATDYPTGIFSVEKTNAKGEWEQTNEWSMRDSGISIEMNSAPPQTVTGQPNLKITYASKAAVVSTRNAKSEEQTITIQKQTRKDVEQKYNTSKKKWEDYKTIQTTIDFAPQNMGIFRLDAPKTPLEIKAYAYNGSAWVREDTGKLKVDIAAYGSDAGVEGKNRGKGLFDGYGNVKASTITNKTSYSSAFTTKTGKYRYKTTYLVQKKTFRIKIEYTQVYLSGGSARNEGRNAFFASSKALVYGNGIINQAFLTASNAKNYNSRVWYSNAIDPYYFPDTNYIEVGATDKTVMGLIKVGDYLGIVKQGGATDTSVYLAYATSFEESTTYAVKQSVNGIGAISNGAFNILNDEPLFLSAEGVMGIEPAEDDSRKIRNRSYYINKPLLAEPGLSSAFSFVYQGMYWLGINNHCYVLDGSQKNSWENTKTNLQYEAYYLDNIPAKCFAKKDGRLWFIDGLGNVCRFKDENDDLRYVDAYNVAKATKFVTNTEPDEEGTKATINLSDIDEILDGQYGYSVSRATNVQIWANNWYNNGESITIAKRIREVTSCSAEYGDEPYSPTVVESRDLQFGATDLGDGRWTLSVPPGESAFLNVEGFERLSLVWYYTYYESSPESIQIGDVVQFGASFYTVTEIDEDNEKVSVVEGVPIRAVWSTIADDDGSAHYYKKLQKKGSLVALMPMSDSGVKVWLNPDGKPENEWIFVGETDAKQTTLPFNYYLKKKVKKYKRLQIICENESYNDGFGIDEIIKSYTLGSYAKR